MSDSSKVTVLGAGSWGTALASHLSGSGRVVTLWGRDKEVLSAIEQNASNPRYFPSTKLNANIHTTTELSEALPDACLVVFAVPSSSMRVVAKEAAPGLSNESLVVSTAKGLESDSQKTMHEVLSEELGGAERITVLGGPSFALEVLKGLPTAVVIAGRDTERTQEAANYFHHNNFRVYTSNDVVGVEIGGAVKNVIALGVGVCRGMGLGASAEAALIARGFAELSRLATRLGANPQTLMGLSGLGDLVLTCSGTQSRNFAYGMAIGEGKDTSGLPLAEGAFTAGIAASIAGESGIEAPLISTVAKLVDGTITPRAALQELLARPLRNESEE